MNVAADGSKITSKGSRCEDGDAFDIDFDSGVSGPCGDDDGNMNFSGNVMINGNKFTKKPNNVAGGFSPVKIDLQVTGTFSGGTVSGVFTKWVNGRKCTATWRATPR